MADILDDDFEIKIRAEMERQREARGKARYEWAHEMTGQAITTPWEDLKPEQKQKVYDEMARYDQEMQALGEAISSGKFNSGLTMAAVIASNL